MQLVILTEGSQTEVLYFNALINHFGCINVSVFPGTSPDPMRLLREAMQLTETHNCEVWVVLDAEVPGQDRVRDRRLKKALEDGNRFGIHFAVSEPCFEAWLLSHFNGDKSYNFKKNSKFYADLLTRKLGRPYRKSDYDTAPFLEESHLQSALKSPTGERGLASLLKKLFTHSN